ncbi:MAG: hypothetical protein Q8L86_14080 [Vicinamibacterales bacterium]|nr:hypothetical protein [Vicinamibacterales bacterium]
MTLDQWLADAKADAERRGVEGLPALLETLAAATAALRAADWNDVADGPSPVDEESA